MTIDKFPPTSCNAWEDCKHDGVCHDPETCGAIGPNAREETAIELTEEMDRVALNLLPKWARDEITSLRRIIKERDKHPSLAAIEDLELPDDLRLPLHSLQADLGWLFGRVAEDGSMASMCEDSVRSRLSQIESACYRIASASLASAQSTRDAIFAQLGEPDYKLARWSQSAEPWHYWSRESIEAAISRVLAATAYTGQVKPVAGETERYVRASQWLQKRWSQKDPNTAHIRQLADYEAFLAGAPRP